MVHEELLSFSRRGTAGCSESAPLVWAKNETADAKPSLFAGDLVRMDAGARPAGSGTLALMLNLMPNGFSMPIDAQDPPPGRRPASGGVLHSPHTEEDYGRLRADVARVVSHVCPAWLASRSDDLVQAVLMRVVETQRKREGNIEFSTFYLRKVAHSALVDEIRRWRRRREVPLDGQSEEVTPAVAEPDPERHSAGRQLGRAIRECLQTLVRPRRLAVILNLQGHSVPEVGQLLRWSVKRAENLVYRGLADLRACLERKGVAP
jgi:RNA polymerase sigma-70 factor (ECF subfamily)